MTATENVSESKVRDLHNEFVIMDPVGNGIVCRNGWGMHVAKVLSELLGKEIELTVFGNDDDDNRVEFYTSCHRLTIPERHTITMMNKYFDTYRPGFRAKDGDINLPYALHALAAPTNFLNEADAHELAAAIMEAFNPDSVNVMATDEGYTVVVCDSGGDLNGWASERIAAIAEVVRAFSLTPKLKESFYTTGDAEARYCSAPWQLSVANRYTQQQRIEDGIAAILAHLGHPEAPGRENIPSAHSDPQRAAKGGKTASSKSAPVAVDVFDEAGGNGDKHRLPAPSRKSAKSSAKSK